MVVPLHIAMVPPALGLAPDPARRRPYLGHYQLEVLPPGVRMGEEAGKFAMEIKEAGDTLVWRNLSRSAGPPQFVLSPAGEDDFTRASRDSLGQYWIQPGVLVSFTQSNGRATGFEVQLENGAIASRGTRMP